MQRTRLVATLVLCVVAVVATAAVKHRPRVLPLSECSEVYRQCIGIEGVEVSYIHGRRFDDSTRLDMTVLRADDSASWVHLLSDLGFSDEWLTINASYATQSTPSIHIALGVRDNPSQIPRGDEDKVDFLSFQWTTYELSIIHINSLEQRNIIIDYLFNETFNPIT